MVDWDTKEISFLLACDPNGAVVHCGMLWQLFQLEYVAMSGGIAAFPDATNPDKISLVVPSGIVLDKDTMCVCCCGNGRLRGIPL